MSTHRYTSTGQPWHVQPMPDRNRTRNNGARFEPTERPMSIRFTAAFITFCLSLTGYGVGVSLEWVPNIAGLLL